MTKVELFLQFLLKIHLQHLMPLSTRTESELESMSLLVHKPIKRNQVDSHRLRMKRKLFQFSSSSRMSQHSQ